MPKIKTLRRCPLFRELSYRDLAILAPHVREETAKLNTWIAEEGKPTNGLIILREGKVRLTVSQAKDATLEIGPGEFFGEMSLVNSDQKRAVGAQATEPCEFLRIPPTDYHHLMTEAPNVAAKIAQGILEVMTDKLDATRKLVLDLASGKSMQ